VLHLSSRWLVRFGVHCAGGDVGVGVVRRPRRRRRMATPRKPTVPTADAVVPICAPLDDLFRRLPQRTAPGQYLIGLLLPRAHNKTLSVLAALVPDADRQRLHHFLHDAPWDADALNQRRLSLWQKHPTLGPHTTGVLIIDETGDRKRGRGIT